MIAKAKTPKKTVSASPVDAIQLLRDDHASVSELFKKFEAASGNDEKSQIVQEICTELSVHAQIEEEIFYPAVQEALDDEELVPEATVEHQSIKDLVAQLEDMDPEEELYDAKVKVMSEWVKHHVKEEQDEMFPKVKKTELDLEELGQQLAIRKEELLADLQQDD